MEQEISMVDQVWYAKSMGHQVELFHFTIVGPLLKSFANVQQNPPGN